MMSISQTHDSFEHKIVSDSRYYSEAASPANKLDTILSKRQQQKRHFVSSSSCVVYSKQVDSHVPPLLSVVCQSHAISIIQIHPLFDVVYPLYYWLSFPSSSFYFVFQDHSLYSILSYKVP